MLVAYLIGLAISLVSWVWWFDDWFESIGLPGWAPTSALLKWAWGAGVSSTAVSMWLVEDTTLPLTDLGSWLMWAQLVTGLAWAALFHLAQRTRTAFYVVCLHWSAVALAAAAAAALQPGAGLVMLPWLAFVTYVGAFNFFAWQLESRP